MVDPLSYLSFKPVLHDWCNKGCGMCDLVCRGGAYKLTLGVNKIFYYIYIYIYIYCVCVCIYIYIYICMCVWVWV